MQSKVIECLNINEMKQCVSCSNLEISFIALVISSWHFDNLLAYVRYAQLTHGILIVAPQGNINDKSKFRLSKEDIEPYTIIFDEVIYCKFDLNLNLDFYSILKNLLPRIKTKKLLFINPGKPYLKLILSLRLYNSSLSFISIDEGLGTYVPAHEFGSEKSSYYALVLSRINQKIVDLISYFILKRIYSFHLYSLDRNSDTLIPNLSVSNMLYNVYYERNSLILKEQETIIIFKDFEFVNSDFIDDLFSEILTLLSTYDLKIIIKKHPNDTRITFNDFVARFKNVEVICNNKSGEELLSEICPLFIIGGFSTVLFSSSTIFNCKAISYMLLYNSLKLPSKTERHLNFFFQNFQHNGNVKFPSSISELLLECNRSLSIQA